MLPLAFLAYGHCLVGGATTLAAVLGTGKPSVLVLAMVSLGCFLHTAARAHQSLMGSAHARKAARYTLVTCSML